MMVWFAPNVLFPIVDDGMLKMDCFYEAKSASMRSSELRLLVLCGKGGSGFSLGGPFLAGDWSIGSLKGGSGFLGTGLASGGKFSTSSAVGSLGGGTLLTPKGRSCPL